MLPAGTAADLYDQYICDLGGVPDWYAPLIWLSDSYRRAKSIRHLFEQMWHKDKSQLSRSRQTDCLVQCNRKQRQGCKL